MRRPAEAELASEGRRLKLAAALRRKADAEAAAPGLDATRGQACPAPQGRDPRRPAPGRDRGRCAPGTSGRGHGARLSRRVEQAASGSTPNWRATDPSAVDAGAELARLRSLLAVIERTPGGRGLSLAGLRSRSAGLAGERQDSDVIRPMKRRLVSAALRDDGPAVRPTDAGIAGRRIRAAHQGSRGRRRTRGRCPALWCGGRGARGCRNGAPSQGREEHQELRTLWLDVREERLSNAAAEFAARLEHGRAVPGLRQRGAPGAGSDS